MNPPLRLRIFTRADVPFADSLRVLAGWNQTPADWERFIALEPAGCFLAEWDGASAGTATTMVYGPGLAWIGMILVHPEYRRRGIGRALLTRCIEHLHGRGVRCIKLDATPLGKKVYDGLGFKEEWTLTRWQREPGTAAPLSAPMALPLPVRNKRGEGHPTSDSPAHLHARRPSSPQPSSPSEGGEGVEPGALNTYPTGEGERAASPGTNDDSRIRLWAEPDSEAIESFDAPAFGISRRKLVQLLAEGSHCALVLEKEPGRIDGYGLLRNGSQALYLGPVVAPSPDIGSRLADALIDRGRERKIFWDIPDQNLAAKARARQHGFTAQRLLTRMVLGESSAPGNPPMQFAIAGPEIG